MGLKGLVTFGLWGNNPMYLQGALRNLEIWSESRFDVDCRFYVGDDVPDSIKSTLVDRGAQLMEMVRWPCDQTSTFWRWDAFATASNFYDYILSRDVDSRPFEREFGAIDEWLASNLPVHVIRDHPYHGVPILAGLFGVKGKGMLESFAAMCPARPSENFYEIVNQKFRQHYSSNNFYQVDQHWLRFNVYNNLRNRVLAHDRFFGFERKRYKAFLPDEPENRFCGEGFDEHDRPRYPNHRDLIASWPKRAVPTGRHEMLQARQNWL